MKNGDIAGCTIANNLSDAIKAAHQIGSDELFIIGGAQIYAQALRANLVDRLILTEVKRDFDADAFFPEINPQQWQEIWRESHHDEASGLDFDFVDYRKIEAKTQ